MFAWSPVLCRRDTAAVVQRSVPVLRYLEKVVHPRWHTPLKTTKRWWLAREPALAIERGCQLRRPIV